MYNCLIVDDLHECIHPLLKALNIKVDYRPNIDRAGILREISGFEILIIRSKTRVDAELLNAAKKLKIIGRAGAGLDQIDIVLARQRNITLLNAPEGNRQAVGEHALGMLLSLMNNFERSNSQVKNKVWEREPNRGYEIAGKTIGIIGYGHMGRSFAKCLSGLDCKVIAYDQQAFDSEDEFAEQVDLPEVYENADVVSLHVPLTPDSEQFVSEDFFNRFRKKIWFLNTSRGKVVETKAVLTAIQKNQLFGAGLDVLHNEKIATYSETEVALLEALSACENVIFTPHVAGWTFESYRKISEVLGAKIKAEIEN